MRVTFVCMGAKNLGIEGLSSHLKQHSHQTQLIFDPTLFDEKYYLENELSKYLPTYL